MQTVNHKIYGVGEVINKETTENSSYITVKFESGKEARFSIPDSFTLGIMEANGDLKDEVDAAISEKRAREAARLEELRAASTVATTGTPSCRHGRTPTSPVTVKGPVELAFEEYLINAGYKEETDSGNPSTVFSYTNAIKKVLEEEGVSWNTLQRDIENIIEQFNSISYRNRCKSYIITTEKDAARILNMDIPQDIKKHIYALPLRVKIIDNEDSILENCVLNMIKS